jgi:dihydrofolate reductase
METPRISLIAALGIRTRVIGANNGLVWRIPEDLRRFKALTMGHPVLMGRRTYESIGKALPGRMNIVVSDSPLEAPEDVSVCFSLDEAIALGRAQHTDELFVIGGGQVYAQTLSHADRLYLTLVDDDTPGDTCFPAYEHLPFTETAREEGTHGTLRYAFVTYDRMS